MRSGRVTESWFGVVRVILRPQQWGRASPVQSGTVAVSGSKLQQVAAECRFPLAGVLGLLGVAGLAAWMANGAKSGETEQKIVCQRAWRTACVVRSEHQVAIKEGV